MNPIDTKVQVADIFTKPLSRDTSPYLREMMEWKSNRVKFALTSGIAQLALLLAHHCFDLILNIINIREKRHVCRRWHCCLFYMSSALHGLLKTMSYSVIEEHQLKVIKGP